MVRRPKQVCKKEKLEVAFLFVLLNCSDYVDYYWDISKKFSL